MPFSQFPTICLIRTCHHKFALSIRRKRHVAACLIILNSSFASIFQFKQLEYCSLQQFLFVVCVALDNLILEMLCTTFTICRNIN